MSEVTIRIAAERDCDAIVSLWREMADLHAEIEPAVWTLGPDADEHWRRHLSDCLDSGDFRVFVAVQGRQTVGFLLASKAKRPPVLHPPTQGAIHDTCVTRSARRRGIGKRLVAAAIDWFRSEGLPMATVAYALGNPASGPFWRAQGFSPYQTAAVRAVLTDRIDANMTGRRADYAQISEVYDAARRNDRPHVEWWLRRLAEVGGLRTGTRLLDLGCGTGRWTIPLVERTGCHAVGIDSSPEMLAKARAKGQTGRITWLVGDVNAPPVPPESFDCALMSLMLHHLEQPVIALRAAFAALRRGGVLLVRQGTLEQIIDDVAHRFFPEALTIDRKRTPLRAEVDNWLTEAGFDHVTAEPIRRPTHKSPHEWLLEAEPRVCSVFRMISDEAHARGLARLREYIDAQPDDPWLVEEELTLFVARRPT